MTFPRFNIEQSDTEFYTSQSGVALVGLAINRFTTLSSRVVKAAPCKGIATADVLRCYLGLLCQGKSDFEAIRPFFEDDEFFAVAEATMRIVGRVSQKSQGRVLNT